MLFSRQITIWYCFKQNKLNSDSELEINFYEILTKGYTVSVDNLLKFADDKVKVQILSSFNKSFTNREEPVTYQYEVKEVLYWIFRLKLGLTQILKEEAEKHLSSTNNTVLQRKSVKRLKNFEKDIQLLTTKKLKIYEGLAEKISPQNVINFLVKSVFKTTIELLKLKDFDCFGFQQIQIDLNYMKYFSREHLVSPDFDHVDGFFMDGYKKLASRTTNLKKFDDQVAY